MWWEESEADSMFLTSYSDHSNSVKKSQVQEDEEVLPVWGMLLCLVVTLGVLVLILLINIF